MKKILLILAGVMAVVSCTSNPEWESLFNGENLDGWKQVNGTSSYQVVDGVIVGTPVEGSENSFLATEKTYGDFILEFEFKIDEGTNSGIQFRSFINDEGLVSGLQFEFDGSERSWTGGVYDQARGAGYIL